MDEAENGVISSKRLDLLIGHSFEILRQAAYDIPDVENLLKEFEQG